MKIDMTLHLNNEPFKSIKSGNKTIEMRLFDEKRRKLKKDNIIEFINRVDEEVLYAKIIDLHIFKNFKELYNNFDKICLGYEINEIANPNDMNKYYFIEEQEKYGVVGIVIKLI